MILKPLPYLAIWFKVFPYPSPTLPYDFKASPLPAHSCKSHIYNNYDKVPHEKEKKS